MKSLIDGIELFQHQVFPEYRELFQALAAQQSPEVLLVTCSDSRIDPSLVTQAKPGELFLVRNAGNIVPPYPAGGGEGATIEYALRALGVRNIVVCGHTDCGAMRGLLHPETIGALPTLRHWLKTADAARTVLDELGPEAGESVRLRKLTEANVLLQMENLRTHPAVCEALERGDLHILGALYEIESGAFDLYCPRSGRFAPLREVDLGDLSANPPAEQAVAPDSSD